MTEQIIVTELPMRWDQKMQRRSDFTMTIQLLEDDEVTPKPTTGYTMSVYIRAAPNGELYDELTIGAEITHTAALGLFTIRVPAATIDAYKFQRAIYDVQLTDAGGAKSVPFAGDLVIEGLKP